MLLRVAAQVFAEYINVEHFAASNLGNKATFVKFQPPRAFEIHVARDFFSMGEDLLQLGLNVFMQERAKLAGGDSAVQLIEQQKKAGEIRQPLEK